MTNKQKLVIANVAVLIVAALAVWLLFRSSSTEPPSGRRPAPPAAPQRSIGAAGPPSSPGALPGPDDDPAGPLLLEGQVLDPDGQPAGGATVLLASRPPRTAVTEADGSFAFDRLVPRAYWLSAHRGDATAGPLQHDLRPTSEPVVVRLVVGAVIEATVVAADTGAPIAGAAVAVDRGLASATTGADGRARLVGAPRGMLLGVRAAAPGRAPGIETVLVPDAPGGVASALIALHAGAAVSGVVVEVGGRPVAGASVMPAPAGERAAASSLPEPALTDAAGRFHIPALAPGVYRFRARHRGHIDGVSPPRGVDGPLADVRIELARGASVSGQVVDRRGAPAPWARVVLGAGVRREQAGEHHGQRGTADEAGAFRLEGVPPRVFSLLAADDEATSKPVEVDLTRGDRDGLVLRLEEDGRIAGAVVDEAGRPVAEAVVQAVPDFFGAVISDGQLLGGMAQVVSDGDGRFELRGRPEGKYRLVAGRTGSERLNPSEVGVKAATGDLAVRLVVSTPGAVRGRVRFADGRVPSSFSVRVGRRGPLVFTSPGGDFTVPEADPGAQQLIVRGADFATKATSIVVVAGAERDAGVIVVERGRTIRGRVLAGGRPAPGALVVAGPTLFAGSASLALTGPLAQETATRRATADGDGRFELVGLEPGDLLIAAEHEREGRSPAVSVARDTDQVDLALSAFASVHGTVTRNGRTAAGLVEVTQGRFRAGFEAAEDGVYDLPRLAAGEYTISGPITYRPDEPVASRTVRLAPGQRLRVDLAADGSGPALTVSLRPAGDRPIELAQIVLVDGHASPSTARELLGLDPASIRGATPTTDESRFAGLRPGPYSVCVTPLPAGASDPVVAARFFERPERVALRCAPITVAPAPPEQRYTAVVPAMAAP